MTTNITRRTALSGIATAIAAPTGAIAATPLSSRLDALIAAHKAAVKAYDEALDVYAVEDEADKFSQSKREIWVELSTGDALCLSAHGDLAEIKADFIDGVKRQYKPLFANPRITRIAPDISEKNDAVVKRMIATDIKAVRKAIKAEEKYRAAHPYYQADAASRVASNAEMAAGRAVFSYRCKNLDEVTRKAEYLYSFRNSGSCGPFYDPEDVEAFLESMIAQPMA